jgi:hypothetical protein
MYVLLLHGLILKDTHILLPGALSIVLCNAIFTKAQISAHFNSKALGN